MISGDISTIRLELLLSQIRRSLFPKESRPRRTSVEELGRGVRGNVVAKLVSAIDEVEALAMKAVSVAMVHVDGLPGPDSGRGPEERGLGEVRGEDGTDGEDC